MINHQWADILSFTAFKSSVFASSKSLIKRDFYIKRKPSMVSQKVVCTVYSGATLDYIFTGTLSFL